MEIHGKAPWFSVEAAPNELVIVAHLPYPTREEVEKCQNCPFDRCRDCIGKRKDTFKEPHRPPVYDVTIIRQLVSSGVGYEKIMDETGCSESTARRYVRKFVRSA